MKIISQYDAHYIDIFFDYLDSLKSLEIAHEIFKSDMGWDNISNDSSKGEVTSQDKENYSNISALK